MGFILVHPAFPLTVPPWSRAKYPFCVWSQEQGAPHGCLRPPALSHQCHHPCCPFERFGPAQSSCSPCSPLLHLQPGQCSAVTHPCAPVVCGSQHWPGQHPHDLLYSEVVCPWWQLPDIMVFVPSRVQGWATCTF